MPDRIHMLVSIPPKISVSSFMGYLKGTVQVDLVYRNGEWFIIEINPRWSGMTTTTAAMEGRNPLVIFVDSILGTDKNYSMKRNLKYALNFKMKARTQEESLAY